MPRIPQAAFDTNPTGRVEAARVNTAPTGEDRLANAAINLTGAVAQLQDQQERTDAFSAANQIKNSYLQQKMHYAQALESVKGDGSYSYTDPTDDNPDVAKRRVISGKNINDEYKKLHATYEQGMQTADSLNRGDIAKELIGQYVGDDLYQLKLNTNKQIFKKKQKETTDSVIQNSELMFNNLLNNFTSETPDPVMTDAKVTQAVVALKREAQQSKPILGDANYKKVQTYHDNLYKQYANEIIKTGVNESTMAAADKLLGNISSPVQREIAKSGLERTKKIHSTVTIQANQNRMATIIGEINKAPVLDGLKLQEAIQVATVLKNSYVDPRYTSITKEQIDAQYTDAVSQLIAKRVSQESIMDSTLRKLVEPSPGDKFTGEALGNTDYVTQRADTGRSPGNTDFANEQAAKWGVHELDHQQVAECIDENDNWESCKPGEPPKQANVEDLDKKLRARIEDSIESTQLKDALGDLKARVVETTMSTVKQKFADARNNIADIVDASNPRATPAERITLIKQAALAMNAGEPSYVSKKQAAQFMQDFDVNMNQGADKALMHINHVLAPIGGPDAGPQSTKRAVMIDIVRGNEKLNYLVPLADMPPSRQLELLTAASQYKQNLSQTGLKASDVKAAVAGKLDENFRNIPPQLRDGVHQNLINETVRLTAEGSSVADAASTAISRFNKDYMMLKPTDSDTQLMLKDEAGTEYAKYKEELKEAATSITTLPDLSQEEKKKILSRYQGGIDTSKLSSDTVDFYMQKILKLVPSERYPNVHVIRTLNDAPVYRENRMPIFYDGKQLIEIGKTNLAKKKADSASTSLWR